MALIETAVLHPNPYPNPNPYLVAFEQDMALVETAVALQCS